MDPLLDRLGNWPSTDGLLMRFKPAFYVLQFLVPKHQRDADHNHREMTKQWLDRRLKMKETRNDLFITLSMYTIVFPMQFRGLTFACVSRNVFELGGER